MSTDYIEPDEMPTVQIAQVRAAMVPRQGTTVLFHHYSDGTVTASSRGLTGTGHSTAEALADLERQLQAAPAHP